MNGVRIKTINLKGIQLDNLSGINLNLELRKKNLELGIFFAFSLFLISQCHCPPERYRQDN
jgi:hypothetical protein